VSAASRAAARASRRTRNANRHLPARWIDVSADEATAHAVARAAMARRHYTPRGAVADGVALYQYGTLAREFFSDLLSLGLFARLVGRPDGYARIAVWTEPIDGGTRVSVSLVTGVFHAAALRTTIGELIQDFAAAGSLIRSGDAFSGLDLPPDSPGYPMAHRR
jgi:hypothetical protein